MSVALSTCQTKIKSLLLIRLQIRYLIADEAREHYWKNGGQGLVCKAVHFVGWLPRL